MAGRAHVSSAARRCAASQLLPACRPLCGPAHAANLFPPVVGAASIGRRLGRAGALALALAAGLLVRLRVSSGGRRTQPPCSAGPDVASCTAGTRTRRPTRPFQSPIAARSGPLTAPLRVAGSPPSSVLPRARYRSGRPETSSAKVASSSTMSCSACTGAQHSRETWATVGSLTAPTNVQRQRCSLTTQGCDEEIHYADEHAASADACDGRLTAWL
jgi:hypothetical protein